MKWQEYEIGLEDRLADLHGRLHRGAYRAQPSGRVYIPKADGRQGPLGIAPLEDKIAQQAVVTILNQIYEVDFQGFSYEFRSDRDGTDFPAACSSVFRGAHERMRKKLDELHRIISVLETLDTPASQATSATAGA